MVRFHYTHRVKPRCDAGHGVRAEFSAVVVGVAPRRDIPPLVLTPVPAFDILKGFGSDSN